MRTSLLSLALLPALALTQAAPQPAPPAPPKKGLTPDQVAYQQALADTRARLDALRTAATTAYNAELTREESPTCPSTNTTYDINMCLARESDLTDANYKAFTTALRAMIAMPVPKVPGAPDTPYVGPSGPEATPATNTAAFDAAESAWHAYATAECGAVDTYWRGGTIVNSMVGECDLRLARARLHELDAVYNVTHPH